MIALLLLGCALGGGTTVVDTDGLDRSCLDPTDCRAAYVGDACGCGCDAVGVSASGYEAWLVRWEEAQDQCREVLACGACPEVNLTCESGTCVVAQ